MQGPAGAAAPGLAAAPPFGLEAPCLRQQTTGIHLLPLGRRAPLSRPLTIPRISRVTEGFVSPWGHHTFGNTTGHLGACGLRPRNCAASVEPSVRGVRAAIDRSFLVSAPDCASSTHPYWGRN